MTFYVNKQKYRFLTLLLHFISPAFISLIINLPSPRSADKIKRDVLLGTNILQVPIGSITSFENLSRIM